MKKRIKAFGYRISGLEKLRKILIGHQDQLNIHQDQLYTHQVQLNSHQEQLDIYQEQLNDSKLQIDKCNIFIQQLRDEQERLQYSKVEEEQPNTEIHANMPYFSLSVRGITYFYDRQDTVMPNFMLNSGLNWAEDEIEKFIKVSDDYYKQKNDRGGVPQKGLFLDIGGNIGTTSIYCKMKLKKEFKYIAFEPLTVSEKLFAANAVINGVSSDISIQKVALSDQQRERVPMVINYQNWGGSGLALNEGTSDSVNEGDEMVETTTLDHFLEENHIDRSSIKYIWIDVEGHEPEVLQGAALLYQKYEIPTCLEFNPNHYIVNHTYEKMVKMLEKYFDRFIVYQQAADGKESWRPINEVQLLWDELDHKCIYDLILI